MDANSARLETGLARAWRSLLELEKICEEMGLETYLEDVHGMKMHVYAMQMERLAAGRALRTQRLRPH